MISAIIISEGTFLGNHFISILLISLKEILTFKGMVKIDLHIHTKRYSSCSGLEPQHLVDMAPFLPIDAVVFTEHDVLWPKDEVAELQEMAGPSLRFYRGIEVTCYEGHFLVYGLESSKGLSIDMPLAELVKITEAEEAAIVLAHPGRFFPVPEENPTPEWLKIHGIETMSFNIRGPLAQGITQSLERLKKPPLAGSDGHGSWAPGLYGSIFPHLPENEKELASMLRSGSAVPWANEKAINAVQKEIPEIELLTTPPLPENWK